MKTVHKKVKMHKIDSSTIASIGWRDNVLLVKFKKAKDPKEHYQYKNVPESIFKQLLSANEANSRIGDHQVSVGSLFHTLIKLHPNVYPFEKHTGPVKPA